MATRNPLIHSFTLHSEDQMRLELFQGQGHPVWLRSGSDGVLFLPFGCNKEQQAAAKVGTRRRSQDIRICES